MDNINIFEVMSKVTQRFEPFHSEVLSQFFTKDITENCIFFRAFLKLAVTEELYNKIDDHFDPSNIEIISEDSFEDKRRIDISIKITNIRFVVGIEVKTNDLSTELGQLSGYYNRLKTKYDNSVHIESISKLGEHIIKMLEGIMTAFKDEDIELALDINSMDEILDDEYDKEVKGLINISKTASNIELEEAMRALLVLKQIERAGDHITNIAENIVYLVNGKRVELN